MLADLTLDDCYFRMLASHELGRGCGLDVDFPATRQLRRLGFRG